MTEETKTGTELFREIVSYDYGILGRREIMVEVWSVTPWVINCYTGSIGSAERNEIRDWCLESFGPEAMPIHGKAGNWQFGNVTINGWQWIGFADEDMLFAFLRKWENNTDRETRLRYGQGLCKKCGQHADYYPGGEKLRPHTAKSGRACRHTRAEKPIGILPIAERENQ